MRDGKKILAIITARGGSKGIPHKNIIPLCGKPLVGYSIEAAQRSKYIDKIFVTTDDPEIARVSETFGIQIPFLRPKELALDTSTSEDAILHCLEWVKKNDMNKYDFFILLQPTSPLRTENHIDEAIEIYLKSHEAKSLISVTPVKQHPSWMKIITADGLLKNYSGDQLHNTRRQDLPLVYIPNGAIYLSDIELFIGMKSFTAGKTLPYIMPEQVSYDIDTLSDLKQIENILLSKGDSENPFAGDVAK